MAQISISNGLSYIDAGSLTEAQANLVLGAIEAIGGPLTDQVHSELAPCEPAEYVERFCELHEREHGEPFVAW